MVWILCWYTKIWIISSRIKVSGYCGVYSMGMDPLQKSFNLCYRRKSTKRGERADDLLLSARQLGEVWNPRATAFLREPRRHVTMPEGGQNTARASRYETSYPASVCSILIESWLSLNVCCTRIFSDRLTGNDLASVIKVSVALPALWKLCNDQCWAIWQVSKSIKHSILCVVSDTGSTNQLNLC